MEVVLLWRRGAEGELPPTQTVAARLRRQFEPLLADAPEVRTLETAAAALVALELPVANWRPPFHEDDGRTWVQAMQYPINAHAVLHGADPPPRGPTLPALCRALEADPERLLDVLVPPFSLAWRTKGSEDVLVQNDGLGHAQLFEYAADGVWALTNRVAALRALGIALEIDAAEWAARATLPWFPLETTGYKRVGFLPPATRLRVGRRGVTRSSHDVLGGWVRPDGIRPAECLELAHASVLDLIRAAMPHWERPSAGLSGGWDSRAVVASLRASGADFSVRVKGLPGREDVTVASRLADAAGLDLRVKADDGLPPDSAEGCRRCIARALRWQGGHMATAEHKAFLANGSLIGGGEVNVMGQHGEIGRAKLARKIKPGRNGRDPYEDRLVRKMTKKMPPFLRDELREPVEDAIRAAYRRADRYGLEGPARLDFFHLSERTRRWGAGTFNEQAGLVFAPFLNPGYIRAAFALSGRHERDDPFHRHIVAVSAPEWRDIETTRKVGREYRPGTHWRSPTTDNKSYDSSLYWRQVGAPVIQEALAVDGAWTEVFDPDAARRDWHLRPDPLAIVQGLDGALLD